MPVFETPQLERRRPAGFGRQPPGLRRPAPQRALGRPSFRPEDLARVRADRNLHGVDQMGEVSPWAPALSPWRVGAPGRSRPRGPGWSAADDAPQGGWSHRSSSRTSCRTSCRMAGAGTPEAAVRLLVAASLGFLYSADARLVVAQRLLVLGSRVVAVVALLRRNVNLVVSVRLRVCVHNVVRHWGLLPRTSGYSGSIVVVRPGSH